MARIIGIRRISGGIGKKELSAKDTALKIKVEYLCSALLSVQLYRDLKNFIYLVGVEGIEPTPPKWPDFESGASTSSAILPYCFCYFYLFFNCKSMHLFLKNNYQNCRKSVVEFLNGYKMFSIKNYMKKIHNFYFSEKCLLTVYLGIFI